MSVLEGMEKHMRKFLWDETEDSRKMHYLSWEKICTPKTHGGLGFKNLRKMNLAFLVKLGWLMLVDKEKLWVKILWAKYGSPLVDKPNQNVSKTWRGIRHAAQLLRAGLESSYFLHDGMDVGESVVT